eukprot:1155807-Pelagomonas_calceolata.AAC.2
METPESVHDMQMEEKEALGVFPRSSSKLLKAGLCRPPPRTLGGGPTHTARACALGYRLTAENLSCWAPRSP